MFIDDEERKEYNTLYSLLSDTSDYPNLSITLQRVSYKVFLYTLERFTKNRVIQFYKTTIRINALLLRIKRFEDIQREMI